MADPRPKPEPEVTEAGGLELPNFPALSEWTDKLRKWCLEALGTIKGLEKDVNELQVELNEAQEREESWDELAEMVLDVERGCREFREVVAFVRGDWVVYELPGGPQPPPSNVRQLADRMDRPTRGAVGTPVEPPTDGGEIAF